MEGREGVYRMPKERDCCEGAWIDGTASESTQEERATSEREVHKPITTMQSKHRGAAAPY